MNLKEIRKRTDRYYYEDGLIELAIGAALLFVALALVAANSIPRNLTIFLVALLPALGAGGVYLASRLAEAAKERITYPRTGYVAYHKPDDASQRRWVVTGLLMLTALVVLLPGRLDSLAVIQGAVFALVFVALGYRVGVRRFYGLAVVSLLVGVGVAFLLPLVPAVATAGTLAGIGGALLVSGGVTFLYYMRHNLEAPTDERH